MFLKFFEHLLAGCTLHKEHILSSKISQGFYQFQVASDKLTVEIQESIKSSYVVQVAEDFLFAHSLYSARINTDSIRANNQA